MSKELRAEITNEQSPLEGSPAKPEGVKQAASHEHQVSSIKQ